MREHLLGLYQIQKIDVAIHDLREKKALIPVELESLLHELNGLKAEVESLSQEGEEQTREASNLQSVVQGETIKLKKWEARLKEIRNQREFQALSREIEGSKRANRDTEEKIMEVWKAKEDVDARLEQKRIRLVELESAYAGRQEEISGALLEVEQLLDGEIARRDELKPSIPERLWRRYSQIRDKRRGVGLVLAQTGSCGGCNVRLPPQQFNVLQRGDTLEQCPSCHRILLFAGFTDVLEPTEEASSEASA